MNKKELAIFVSSFDFRKEIPARGCPDEYFFVSKASAGNNVGLNNEWV